MLHNLLSSLIERVIGSYVEDVNSEKLSIGLLNGDLALSNINLKKDTLHRLFDLPFVLERDCNIIGAKYYTTKKRVLCASSYSFMRLTRAHQSPVRSICSHHVRTILAVHDGTTLISSGFSKQASPHINCRSRNFTEHHRRLESSLIDVSRPTEATTSSQCDAQWPLWRIAVLRLVAMRQAAAKLHRNVIQASRSRTTSRTDSPASNVLPDSPVRSVASPASAISWYAWWRYSSWLGGTSSWWSSSVATVPDSSSSLGDASAENARFSQTRISDQVTAQPVPTVKDAVFELLDELATASEHLDTDRSEPIPSTTPTTIASFRLVCQVEGCSIRLTDIDSPFPLLSEAYVHPAFISISGQQMQFTLEMRPWDRTARFAAGVQSFTVCDERYHTSVNSASSPGKNRPLFPSVIFPQLCLPTSRMRTFFRTLSVPCHSSVSDPSSPSSGLFWLVYEVAPSGDASEYSLEIKTDPLHVVYQPELIKCVMDFFRSVASAASPTLGTSARHQYEVIKERTQANIRAMFDDTTVSPQLSTDEADATPNSDTTTHDSSASIVYSSLSRSRSFRSESGGNRFRLRRWRINLDIAAPRLLLPANPERGRPRSAKDLVGLLCDFGHFRVTNWPSHTEKQTTGLIRLSKSMSNVSQSPANEDENELFLTPCGTPEVQSEDEENVSGGNEVIQKNRSKAQHPTKTKDLYESYVIHLEDLHVLVGKLYELEKLGVWTNSEISEDHDELESGSCVDSSADIMTFHLGTPRLSNRLCLVDRLSLRLLVSRRLIPFSNPQPRCHPRLPESYCPPTFWFTFEQERCVVQLSDSKVYNLLRCLQATTTATTVLQSTRTPDLPTACDQAPAEQQFLSTPVAPSSLDYQEQSKSEHPFRPDMFSLRRKRFIASFRVKELVLQLENKGYPVAECRLEGAAGTLIRLTGRGGAYQGRLLIRSLSVADALTNLGEEYDLLVASNQSVRLKEWSIWSEPHTNEMKQSVECDVSSKEKDGFSPGPLGDPPEGHMLPITEFTGPEPPNGSQRDLMQIYFDWIPSCHSLDKTTRPSSGSRTVHVNINSLDVVYNPETVSEVYSLLRHLSSLVNLFPASEPRPPVPAPHSPSKTVVVNFKLCLEHLSVMLIDICPQTTQPNTDPDVKEPNATRRVERLLLVTIVSSLPAYTSRTASIHLRSVHVSNMYDSSSFLRYLLTSTFTSAKPSTALGDLVLAIRICWSASPPDTPQFPSQIYGCLGHLTYVHDEQMVSRLISYLTTMLPLNCDNSQPGSQFNLPLYSSHRTQFRLEFFTPALFFPDPSSLRVLIARATLIRITNSHLPLCNAESEASSALTVRFHWEDVECVHVNLTQLVPIRAVTQAEQIKWFYIHRDNLHEFFGSGVDPVLERTTSDPICSLQLRVRTVQLREEVDPTSEVRWVENFGLYAYVPYIQVSLMADLDLIPVPLARLQTASFAVCVSLPQRGQEMHFSVFASCCVLFNLLPPDEMKFIGTPTVDTNSVDRILLWASQSSSWDPSSLVLSKWDNSCFLEHSCEQAVGVACSDDDLHSFKVLVCHECEHEKDQLRNMVAYSEHSVVRIRAVLPWVADPQIIDNLYDRPASVRFATAHLLFRLDPQPWVLIMDFCNLFAGRVEAVHKVQSPQTTTVGSNSTAMITHINAEIGSLHLIVRHSGSNEKVGNSKDGSSHCDKDLAMVLCENLTVHIVDRLLNWKQCLPVERQRTPENLLGTCCLVEGSMSNLTVSALSCRENLLYAQRVRLKNRSADHGSDSVRFHLLLSCLPDQDRPREGEDAYLWIRLDPVQYVHTQSFLTGILDTLNGFVQNYDLMARARASSEGLQLPTIAPNSLRILLDLCVDSPTLIVPVSATSPECLVAMMHRLQVYNSFFWVTDDPCYPGLTREFERKHQSDDLEASCASCVKHTQYMHRHPQQPKTTEHQSTGSQYAPEEFYTPVHLFSFSDATDECLYDQITLDLQDTVVYHAKFVEDAIQCLSTSLDVIRFSGYRICPYPGPSSVSPYLFDSRPVSFSVGRNLSSALSHVVPDWRLTSRWNEINFRLTARIYSVIRGILSHNFSGSDYPVQLSNPDLPVWMKRLQQPVQTSQAPVVYPPRPTIQTFIVRHFLSKKLRSLLSCLRIVVFCASPPHGIHSTQTSITGVVWTMITFWFDLQNVQITFYPEPVAVQSHSLPALAPCTQINLTCARFSYDKLSNHRSWMELVCSRCSLVNLRSPDSSLSKPTALQPLFQIRTSLIESTGHSDFPDIKPSGHLRLTYISSTHSSLFMLHASKTNLVFDPVQLSKFVNLIGSDPASSDPDDVSYPPPDEDQSPTKTSSQIVVKPPNVRVTETQICLHDSELVLCEKLEQPHANRVVLHGTCNLLRSSRSTSASSITTTRAVGCLHHLAVDCLDGQKELATLVASLTSARADLVPMVHSIKPPVTSSAASMVSSWRSSTPSVQPTARPQTPPHVPTNAVFRSALPALTAVSTYSGSRLASSMSAFNARLVLSLFETAADGLIPLFELRADQLNLSWRQIPAQSGMIVCSGLAINYFNRDLICWEPAMEPWSTCYLRSGMTITNYLPDGHTLCVALQLTPVVTEHEINATDDVWASQLILLESTSLTTSVDHRIPLLSIQSGQTSPVPLNLAAVASTGLGFLCFCPVAQIVPVTTATPLLRRPVSGRTDPRGIGGTYSWASVHMPYSMPERSMDSSPGDSYMDERKAGMNHLMQLDLEEAARLLDWTRLKLSRELVEVILMSHASVSAGQSGLLGISAIDRAEPNSDAARVPPTPVAISSLLHESAAPHAALDGRRSTAVKPYYMCLALVRDNFPPDPLWVGLPSSSVSDLIHPRQLPGHHLTVGPTVRITNLLPYEMTYFFAGTSLSGDIPVGDSACVFEVFGGIGRGSHFGKPSSRTPKLSTAIGESCNRKGEQMNSGTPDTGLDVITATHTNAGKVVQKQRNYSIPKVLKQ
ncbi:hypothetical protein FGIG_08736 [Fasciola gigantica]|uniref:Vacuolar protein sorting-associated protein 13D n=1 Tax=Fasciola gigantica TaxID=46835 RepID=A0A504YTZ0_FASGI|nr:hypothetical protein FGIG_08736 [Fasciola gigantica]